MSCSLHLPLLPTLPAARKNPAAGLRTMSFQKGYGLVFTRPGLRPLLFKTWAVLLAYLFWFFSLALTNSMSWRVWEFKSDTIPLMYIGLWEVYYAENVNVSGHTLQVTVFARFNGTWGLPNEIYYGQDLMLLADFLAPVALVFSTLAVWASWNREPFPHFFRTCYNTAALHLALSCFCLSLAVAWNFAVDLAGHTTLEFPPKFPVNKHMILSKRVSYMLPLGTIASALSFLSVVLLAMDSCFPEEQEKEEPEVFHLII